MPVVLEQTKFALENRLIVDCAQTRLNESQVERVTDSLRQPLDWTYLVNIAHRNRVLPLVSWNLLQSFNHLLDEEVKKDLTIQYREHVKMNMFFTSNLIMILGLFESNDISVMPFKGPLLAVQAYGNVALRRFGDLDILIRPEQLEKAIELLISLNYTPITEDFLLNGIDSCIKRRKDISFINQDASVCLELHWRLSKPYFGIPLTSEDIWQQGDSMNLGGVKTCNLSFNHLLIYLCLHGSKHGWERLAWICDVNQLIRSNECLNWDVLIEQAGNLGCRNVLYLGLFLCHRFWDLQIPPLVLQRIEKEKTLYKLTEEIQDRLFAEQITPLGMKENYLNQLKLKEQVKDKVKLHLFYTYRYLRRIFSPNEIDKGLLSLPAFLSPLYYVLRSFRLSFNFLFRPKNNPNSKT